MTMAAGTGEAHQTRQGSNSPPPQAPAAQTPGVRASTLTEVFNGALASTLKACSYSNFAACFPTPAKYVPEALDGLHRDFVGRLNEFCKNEFQSLLEDRNVVSSLNELDGLIEEAKKRKSTAQSKDNPHTTSPTPPHMLPPSSILSAHLTPFIASQTEEYNNRLGKTQIANSTLSDEISMQRTEIESLISGLEAVVSDLESAAIAMRGDSMVKVEDDLMKTEVPSV